MKQLRPPVAILDSPQEVSEYLTRTSAVAITGCPGHALPADFQHRLVAACERRHNALVASFAREMHTIIHIAMPRNADVIATVHLHLRTANLNLLPEDNEALASTLSARVRFCLSVFKGDGLVVKLETRLPRGAAGMLPHPGSLPHQDRPMEHTADPYVAIFAVAGEGPAVYPESAVRWRKWEVPDPANSIVAQIKAKHPIDAWGRFQNDGDKPRLLVDLLLQKMQPLVYGDQKHITHNSEMTFLRYYSRVNRSLGTVHEGPLTHPQLRVIGAIAPITRSLLEMVPPSVYVL